MNDCLFEAFAKMIDSFPQEAVLRAAAREKYMLEEDLALGRIPPSENSASILAFCRFLEGAARGSPAFPRNIQMEHWPFYIKTVGRLVAAQELPRNVKEEIEAAFHNVFCCIMA